jgi:hypothetical protein
VRLSASERSLPAQSDDARIAVRSNHIGPTNPRPTVDMALIALNFIPSHDLSVICYYGSEFDVSESLVRWSRLSRSLLSQYVSLA